MWNPRVSGSGNAKLSTAFDVIRRFILLFASDMREIGFIGTAFSIRFHRCAIVLICVPGAPWNMDRAIWWIRWVPLSLERGTVTTALLVFQVPTAVSYILNLGGNTRTRCSAPSLRYRYWIRCNWIVMSFKVSLVAYTDPKIGLKKLSYNTGRL